MVPNVLTLFDFKRLTKDSKANLLGIKGLGISGDPFHLLRLFLSKFQAPPKGLSPSINK